MTSKIIAFIIISILPLIPILTGLRIILKKEWGRF